MTHSHRIGCHCLRLASGAIFAIASYGAHAGSAQSLDIRNSTITNSQTGPGAKAEMNLGSTPVLPRQQPITTASAVDASPPLPRGQASYQNTSLDGQRWARVRMDGASLTNVSAIGIELSGASLQKLRAVNTNFSRARMAGADLRNASFENCDFESADLRGSRLDDARFVSVNWEGADLSGARWSDGRTCAPGSVGACRSK